jgi:aspartate/methionine/tyrosine aminotransferase
MGVREAVARTPLDNIASIAKAALGDPDVIPLWFGEGDVPAPAFIGEAMAKAVREGQVFYTHQNGVPELRAALSAYYRRLGVGEIPIERILATTSGMHAIEMMVRLTCGPGDNVIVIDPVWPNIAGATRLTGAEVRPVRMDHGVSGWTLDLEKVVAAMDAGTRLVFFASPGNPTGAMIPIETQIALLDLCRQRGIWLMADEVYQRIVFDQPSAPSLLSHAEPEDRLISVNSFSKSWAMTGWRIGWMVHPPSLGATLAMMTQYSTSGVATFIQHAAAAAVNEGEGFVAHYRDYCRRGLDIVCDALEGFSRVRLGVRPRAGMYAFFEVEGMTDSRVEAVRILQSCKVGLAPGYFFGPGSDGFLRICVARSAESLAAAMDRLAPALN